MDGEVDVEIHVFLTTALVGGELSVWRANHFTQGGKPPEPIG
jgi:hypothetical protein